MVDIVVAAADNDDGDLSVVVDNDDVADVVVDNDVVVLVCDRRSYDVLFSSSSSSPRLPLPKNDPAVMGEIDVSGKTGKPELKRTRFTGVNKPQKYRKLLNC